MEPKKPFHEFVAEKLIEQLKAGTAPWQRPWEPGEPNAYLPMNPTTGKRYKGINAIHLMAQGRSDGRVGVRPRGGDYVAGEGRVIPAAVFRVDGQVQRLAVP